MIPTTKTEELELKNGEDVTDYFDEMDDEMREEFKDDVPVSEVKLEIKNK